MHIRHFLHIIFALRIVFCPSLSMGDPIVIDKSSPLNEPPLAPMLGGSPHPLNFSPEYAIKRLFQTMFPSLLFNNQPKSGGYSSLGSGAIDLRYYVRDHTRWTSDEDLHSSVPRYHRQIHFGKWIDENKNCLDTRSEVLLRDSMDRDSVVLSKKKRCSVKAGKWNDPYTGRIFRIVKQVQVDHVVPLKNAYYSGAFRWNKAKRCHYANFLDNNYHLRTVSAHENMSKQDRGPEEYLPPNTQFVCNYLREWMKIKAIWQLEVSTQERDAIEYYLDAYKCPVSDYLMDSEELLMERSFADAWVSACSLKKNRLKF